MTVSTAVKYLFSLQWLADTGRFILHLLSFRKVNLPRTDTASVTKEIERRKRRLRKHLGPSEIIRRVRCVLRNWRVVLVRGDHLVTAGVSHVVLSWCRP